MQVYADVRRADALNEVHTLLNQMGHQMGGEADADRAARNEMGCRISELEIELRAGRIQRLELQRQVDGPRRSSEPAGGAEVGFQELGEGAQALEEQFLKLSCARFGIEQEAVAKQEVISARLQASIKELQNQLVSRRELFMRLNQVPSEEFIDRSKEDWLQLVFNGVDQCGSTLSSLISEKAKVAAGLDAQAKVSATAGRLAELCASVCSSRDEVAAAIDTIDQTQSEMESQIRGHFKSLRAAVDQREEQMLQALGAQTTSRKQSLQTTQEGLQRIGDNLSKVSGASDSTTDSKTIEELRSALSENAKLHDQAVEAVQALVTKPVRCWLDPQETQWLGDRLVSYGHVGAEPRRAICTSVVAADASDIDASTGWAHSVPGWRVSHFSMADGSVAATQSHIFLQHPQAVSLVVDVVKTSPHAADVAQNATACLFQLTSAKDAVPMFAENTKLALEHGCVELLMLLMRRHADVLQVQANCCRCLLNLSAMSQTRSQLVDAKVHELIVASIGKHNTDLELVGAAFECLLMLLPAQMEPLTFEDGSFRSRSSGEDLTAAESTALGVAAQVALSVLEQGVLPLCVQCLKAFHAESSSTCRNILHLLGCCVLVVSNGHEKEQVWLPELCAAVSYAIKCMKSFPADRSLTETCVCYLACGGSGGWTLRSTSSNMQAAFSNALHLDGDAFGAILASMRYHLDSTRAQGHGCRLIEALIGHCTVSSTDATQQTAFLEQMRDMDIGSLILGAMRCHPSSAYVQEMASAALCVICSADGVLQDETIKGGLIQVGIGAMDTHPNSVEVQNRMCCLLYALSSEARNRVTIVLEGGCDKALGTLRNHCANRAEISANALALLTALLAEHEAVGAAFASLQDAALLVLGTILCHKKEETVFETACGTLSALMRLDGLNIATIVESGGIQLILENMAIHHNNVKCACRAAEAVGLFAKTSENVAAIVRQDGILRLMASMATHQADGALQTQCARALLAMAPQITDVRADTSQYHDEGGTSLLVDRVLAAMQAHPDEEKLAELGLLVLAEVGRNEFFHQQLLRTDGCEQVLLSSMRWHTSEDNTEAAIKALRRVLPKLAALPAKERQGVVEQLLRAMRSHPARRLLQAASCSILWQLVVVEKEAAPQRELLQAMQDGGANGVVQLALQTHPDSAAVLEHAFLLLGTLGACGDGARAEIVHHNGGIAAILEAVLGCAAVFAALFASCFGSDVGRDSTQPQPLAASIVFVLAVATLLACIVCLLLPLKTQAPPPSPARRYQRRHAGVPLSVLRAACCCLGVLCAGDESAQAVLLEVGGLRLLVNVLLRNSGAAAAVGVGGAVELDEGAALLALAALQAMRRALPAYPSAGSDGGVGGGVGGGGGLAAGPPVAVAATVYAQYVEELGTDDAALAFVGALRFGAGGRGGGGQDDRGPAGLDEEWCGLIALLPCPGYHCA